MPIEDQRAKHRPQDANGVLVPATAVHVALPQPVPFPPTAGKRIPLQRAKRPTKLVLHLVDIWDFQVVVPRMPSEYGHICHRLD